MDGVRGIIAERAVWGRQVTGGQSSGACPNAINCSASDEDTASGIEGGRGEESPRPGLHAAQVDRRRFGDDVNTSSTVSELRPQHLGKASLVVTLSGGGKHCPDHRRADRAEIDDFIEIIKPSGGAGSLPSNLPQGPLHPLHGPGGLR